MHSAAVGPGGPDVAFFQDGRRRMPYDSPMTQPSRPILEPRLIIKGVAEAIAFYKRAFDAREVSRFADPNRDGFIIHAELNVFGATISLAEEKADWGNLSPSAIEASPVLLRVSVDDADAVAAKMIAAGAEVIIPVNDQFYGMREGRLRDPFGHLWIVSQLLEALSDEEVQRRIAGGH